MTDCPVCRSTLRRVSFEGRDLDVCDTCKGIMIENGFPEINITESESRPSRYPIVELGNYKCSACNCRDASMLDVEAGVLVTCVECGKKFFVSSCHPAFLPIAGKSPPNVTIDRKSDSVLSWLGELLSALAGGKW